MARVLLPYRRYWSHYYLAAYMPVSGALALCEWALGHLDAADELFGETERHLADAGAAGLEPLFFLRHAELLAQRRAPGDEERARTLLVRARQEAELMQAPVMVAKCDDLVSRMGGQRAPME